MVRGPERDHRIATKETSVTTARKRPEGKAQGGGDEEAQVLRDALIGVVGLGGVELHAVVRRVPQPRAEVALGEPATPADLQHLVEIELVHRHHDVGGGEIGELEDLRHEHRVVLVLQRVVEGVVPLVEQDVDPDDPEVEGDDGDQQALARPQRSSENQ
jgi:hypothetical protein